MNINDTLSVFEITVTSIGLIDLYFTVLKDEITNGQR